MGLKFFIGSYTEYPIPGFGGIGKGIYAVLMNSNTGTLKIINTTMTRNPSYLTLSKDNLFLYCITELDESEGPKIQAYAVHEDFSLKFLNEQPIAGGYPCHINTHQNSVLVACYATGNIIQYPLEDSGRLSAAKKEYRHSGSSINETRQEGPHAHQIAVHPNKKDIYVCDLGIDTIKAYHMNENALLPDETKDCMVAKGAGPRHLVFSKEGNLAYVLNELTGRISVLQLKDGVFEEVSSYPSLSDNYMGVPSASTIRMHPNGKYLYAANRGFEAITIFRIFDKQLKFVDYQYTQGEEMREFNITRDGNWLIACHQNSHDVVVYKIHNSGKLSETYRTKEILSPVCVVFPN